MRWWSIILALTACTEETSSDAGREDSGLFDSGAADSGVSDTGQQDVGFDDAGGQDASVTDLGPLDGSEAFGFRIRVPRMHEVPCTGMFCGGPTISASDVDYVCDLRYSGFNRYTYVQASPISYLGFMGFLYQVDAAFLSDGVTATPATASYSWGGNHHNDSITFDATTYEVRYDHSSFGFGFRQCQPMDCLVVYEPGPGAELANGCGRDRSVPAICKLVTSTGTVPEWIDTFERCPGDN